MRQKEIEFIFFSFLYRDNDFPAVKKVSRFTLKGLLKSIFLSLKKDLTNLFKGDDDRLINQIFVYCDSINQFRALSFLSSVDNVVFVTMSDILSGQLKDERIFQLRSPICFLERFNFFSYYNFYLLFKSRFGKHIISFFNFITYSKTAKNAIKYFKPRAIIFSNDHNVAPRALLYHAKNLNIPTIYIQHAAVTNKFPPLQFDLSLLEGKDSLRKYKEAGQIDGNIHLVGMPKFDDYRQWINNNKIIESIGFAFNVHDDIKGYFSLALKIRTLLPSLKFKVRFHPSMKSEDYNIPDFFCVSDVRRESSFEFLKDLDCLIAGNSSIHLEAILLNVYSISVIFDRNGQELDYYGFIEYGLVDVYTHNEFLNNFLNLVKQRPQIRSRAKYYVETIDTDFDGRSQELVVNILKKTI